MSAGMIDRPRPALGEAAPWAFPRFTTGVLGNGLKVLHRQIAGQPLAAVSLVIHAPVTAEPAGFMGIGLLLAQAVTQGAADLDADAFAYALEATGASLSVTADQLTFTARLDVPCSRLERALDLMTTAVSSPTLGAEAVERVVGRQLALLKNASAQGTWLVERAVSRTIYAGHRLESGVLGTAESIAAISPAAMKEYAQTILKPSAATVIVAGDIEGIPELLERTLGQWQGDRSPASALLVPGRAERAVVLIDKPGSVQTELRFTAPGVVRGSPEWEAATLAGYVLGGAMNSRLMSRIREELGYTYGIGAGVLASGALSQLRVMTSVEGGVTKAAIEEILEVSATFRSGGVTETELTDAVTAKVAVAPLKLQTARDLVSELTPTVIDGLPDDWAERQYARLCATTLESVNAAALNWAVDEFTLVACGDAEVVRPQLEPFGTVTTVTA